MKTTELRQAVPQPLGLVWIDCTCAALSLELEETLNASAHIYCGHQPPKEGDPSTVIVGLDGEEDIASKLKYYRAQAPNAPILVFDVHIDPQSARAALLAGAHGFLHLGMQPAQVIHILSGASKGQTIVSRTLLEAFLVQINAQAHLVLTPRQRDILEMIAVAATPKGEIAMPRKLLEAFLKEVAIA